jgi:hypothetical protein
MKLYIGAGDKLPAVLAGLDFVMPFLLVDPHGELARAVGNIIPVVLTQRPYCPHQRVGTYFVWDNE